MHLVPQESLLKVNLLTTLLNLADIDAATALADRSIELAKGNVRLLTAIASTYVTAFRAEDAVRVIEEASKVAEHVPGYSGALGTKALKAACALRALHGYGDAELRELFKTAVTVLREFDGVGPLRYTNVTSDEGSVMHHFHVMQTAEVCAELDWRIADRLVENFERAGEEVLTFSCLPLGAYFDLNEDALG
ncbi:hypothetical protein L602_000600000310 [Cupriavidus gilardii J11]|uniref:Uncharacterized protein n=1 Tax=Cupriavidus gilardii J11 TaxID=936133 RepID=A0A562B379_9BURK|nr:hypothetical protein L602_000600000310 [Cupriavidus gilardii J11]